MSSPSVALSACQEIPLGGGRVGAGVFAWGNYFNASSWVFYAHYGPPGPSYTWYVQKLDGTNYTWGTVGDTNIHSTNVPYNSYRWGAQNHFDVQSWNVCHY